MIVARGLGTAKALLPTAGLGLSTVVVPPIPTPTPGPVLYGGYGATREPDRTDHLRRQILREDQLLLEVILLAVTRVLR